VPTMASDDGGELGETAMAGATERSHHPRPCFSWPTIKLPLIPLGRPPVDPAEDDFGASSWG
jgi:hypothetical protein